MKNKREIQVKSKYCSGDISHQVFLIPEFLIFSPEKKLIFIDFISFFLLQSGCSVIYFDEIFPMQSSEFTKSLNFRSIIYFISPTNLFAWIKQILNLK